MSALTLVFNNHTKTSVDKAAIAAHLALVWQRLGQSESRTVELEIVDAKTIQRLNKERLDHDYATDVLSFPAAPELIESTKTLGSIVIAAPIAQQQANAAGITLQDEVNVLAGHSLLHLLGYHHS